jgi:transcriptional regulator GlxA family with amidase domain
MMAYNLEKLFELIHDSLNSAPHLRLSELSQHLGVGRHTLEKAVKKSAKMTFRELRKRMRLERVRVVLYSQPNLSIKQIAFELNYGSHRAFSRFVRDAAGYSPSELRQTSAKE